jgi:hypothetical protein
MTGKNTRELGAANGWQLVATVNDVGVSDDTDQTWTGFILAT